jgi:hypothetical protein
MSSNTLITSRRSILRGMLGGLGVATAVTGAVAVSSIPSLPAATEPVLPITPAEWLAEMHRIGWTAVAGDYRGKPLGVFEYCRDQHGGMDDERWFDTRDARLQLSRRVHLSGPDFYDRTARYLFDLGLREPIGPSVMRCARAMAVGLVGAIVLTAGISFATLPPEARKVELLLPVGGSSIHFKNDLGPRFTAPAPPAKGLWI